MPPAYIFSWHLVIPATGIFSLRLTFLLLRTFLPRLMFDIFA
jgi:hypothetical protein